MSPLTSKHAQLLKSNRALMILLEEFPLAAKLSVVALALAIGVYGSINALKGTTSDQVQLCIRNNKQALQCADKTGKPYIMTQYHAEQWKADGVPGEVVFQKFIPATNPYKALWMALAAGSFSAAGVVLRSLQNSERQLATYEAVAEKRDLAKAQITARAELIEDYRNVAIAEVHLQADLESAANDRAVVLKQCEVLGEADIKIAQLEAEEALFEAETAGLSDEKKQEYLEFLRKQKTPFQFQLTGTQTFDGINDPSDKIESQSDEPRLPKLTNYPAVLVYGPQGSGKTFLAEEEIAERKQAGHKVTALDPHAGFNSWRDCEVIGAGMDYASIDAELANFAAEVKRRYERIRKEPNPQFTPWTFVCDEFTNWASRCKASGEFFQAALSDIRKAKMYVIFVSHARTLAGLGDAKGMAATRDAALLEIELLGQIDPLMSEAVPKFEAFVKLPGQSQADRTLVKLKQKPAPTAPYSTETAETAADYLDRIYNLEFDLSKAETPPETMKRRQDKNSDELRVYFTNLKLDYSKARELVLKLRNEIKHNQSEIIWILWNARPGKTKSYETALSEYKELLKETVGEDND